MTILGLLLILSIVAILVAALSKYIENKK